MADTKEDVPSSRASDLGGLRADMGMPLRADPTPLTTQQLLRENFWLRELLESKLSKIDGRIDASDKAVALLQAFADRTPSTSDVHAEVSSLRDVTIERFSSIQTQLTERDVRAKASEESLKAFSAAQATSAQVAVAAALQAQKEAAAAQNDANAAAITKSEASTVKQIDGIQAQIKSSNDAVNDRIADLKGRLDRGEGAMRGAVDTRSERRSDVSQIWGMVGGVIGILGFIITIIMTAVVLTKAPVDRPTTVVAPAVVPLQQK